MIPESVIRAMATKIQTTRGLEGCLVALYGNQECRVIGYPSCVTRNSQYVAVVIEEVLLREGDAPSESAKVPVAPSNTAKEMARNRTKLGPELLGAGASCGFAFLSGMGAVAGVAGEGVTAGMSTVLVVAAWTGFITGSIQCGNGIVRVGAILSDLDGTSIDLLDQEKMYVSAMLLVDAIGMASNAATLSTSSRQLWDAFTRLQSFSQARLSFETLRNMNQLERLRAISKVFQDATRTGERVEDLVVLAKRAQIAARTMQRASGISVNHAATLQRIIGEESVRQLHIALRDVVLSTIPVGLNALPAALVGSASGSVNLVVNILDAGLPIL